MPKNSFILHHDQKPLIDDMTDAQAGQLIKAIFSYVVDGIVSSTADGMVSGAMYPIRARLDEEAKRYKE